jgi:hypothetical protein
VQLRSRSKKYAYGLPEIAAIKHRTSLTTKSRHMTSVVCDETGARHDAMRTRSS